MKRNALSALLLIVLSVGAVILACSQQATGKTGPISLEPVFPDVDLAALFGSYYEPVPVDVEPDVPSYELPLGSGDVQNLGDVRRKIRASDVAWERVLSNGFTTVAWGSNDDVARAYKSIKKLEVPVFVTSDSLLHLYHIQFDETLREIEEKEFYPDLVAMTRVFQEEMQRRYDGSSGIEREAYKKGLAYFTVARKLLEPETKIPSSVKTRVEWELDRIGKHGGFPRFEEAQERAIFAVPEDYSQYVPRGHYTRSEELKRYFKGMMWYGRLTMLIKGHVKHGPMADKPALVSPAEARAQTILGAAIAGLLGDLEVEGRSAAEVWQRMYAVTAYYVGLADDLCPQDYRTALRKVFGDSFRTSELADKDEMVALQTELARMKPPAIYSCTGASGVDIDVEGALTAEQLDRILGKTMGFRFMGQRYVPDSFILGELVAPSVGLHQTRPAFTTVYIPDFGPVRGFPRGLDVMAVLGSDRAIEILGSMDDTAYIDYDKQMKMLRKQFGEVSQADWNRNLYWSWLYALRGLIQPTMSEGWPTFMRSDAWTDKQLNAALGSWSSLRHDTILYAKQSYTPTIRATSARPPEPIPKPVVGYVEPVPEFYARLVALTRMSIKGLVEMEVLDDQAIGRLESLEGILSRLREISEKELRNEELTEEDYAFIRSFGETLDNVVTGAEQDAQKTTLVADVHTDQNSRSVLEEATGYLRMMIVAYKLPQGHVLVGVGPSFSYYEFKHPMSDRLTDEKWREILGSGKAPLLPEWTRSFASD